MPTITPNNVVQGLPLLTFRGEKAPPYDDLTFNFRHGQAERPYPYIDGASHEATGLDPEEIRARLYFLNGPGLGQENFPRLWNRWWDALRDGSPGEMVHPILGTRQVVVEGGSVQLTSRHTSGVICEVTFSTTILDPEEAQETALVKVNVKELAAKADAKTQQYNIPFPTQEGVTSILDIVKQLDTFAFTISNDIDAIVSKVQSTVAEMIDFIDRNSPEHAVIEARDLLVQIWVAAGEVHDQVTKRLRPTAGVLVANDTTLDQFATDRGNTLAEVMGLNTAALVSPTIKAGTMLRYFSA